MCAVPESEAIVFDVQRFSVHDGPGIRTTVFFKGCPLRCRWCQNPESLRLEPEIAFYADRCHDSHDCRAVCLHDALLWNGDRIARDRCDACGRCAEACGYDAIRLIGRAVSVGGLMQEVMRDVPFYEASGGGVTLSGGEATLQMGFIGAFARRCDQHGVRVGLQTCGLFRWESFAPHLPLFAFIQFDLKLMDPEQHRLMVGGDNRPILDNARGLVDAGAPVPFRMPIVPGITDTELNLRQVAAFLRDLNAPAIHLLRYHALGEAKLARIGHPRPAFQLSDGVDADESVSRAAEALQREGLEVTT
ncbi:MAG: glycyl-radical enzyme activating protein [Candidatus Binatia bacterium]